MSDPYDPKEQLPLVRERMRSLDDRMATVRTELAAKEKTYKRLQDWAEQLERHLHDVAGEERNCKGHVYLTEPSDRGVGFDAKCKHCGHYRTLHPTY